MTRLLPLLCGPETHTCRQGALFFPRFGFRDVHTFVSASRLKNSLSHSFKLSRRTPLPAVHMKGDPIDVIVFGEKDYGFGDVVRGASSL